MIPGFYIIMFEKGGTAVTSKQIEAFMAVAECLNFTQAGEKLFASQSTVSRQISLLEEELGVELFFRNRNYVRLTPAGTIMKTAFLETGKFMEEQVKTAKYMNLGESGTLQIGFISNLNVEAFFEDIINKFNQLYPKIMVNYECYTVAEIGDKVRSGEVDIAITHGFEQMPAPEFVHDVVYHTNMYLIYGKKHPLAGKPDLSLSDFKNDIFWTASVRERLEPIWKKLFGSYGISLWKTREVANFDSALINIRMGNGVGIADPVTLVVDEKVYGILELPPEISKVEIVVNWLKDNMNPALPLFVKLMTDAENKRMLDK